MTVQIAPLIKCSRLEAAAMMMKVVIKDVSKCLSFIFRVVFLHSFFVNDESWYY